MVSIAVTLFFMRKKIVGVNLYIWGIYKIYYIRIKISIFLSKRHNLVLSCQIITKKETL